ncbi:MAG: hypothetical protein K2G70_06720 [Turicibacter sp.]|nr:hypothetical protein [Turicibacter sp.]
MNNGKIMKQPLVILGSLFLIITLLLMGLLLYQFKGLTGSGKTNDLANVSDSVTSEDNLEKEYQLASTATDYQKEIFDELVTAHRSYKETRTQDSKENYAALVVKNFIADFYTLSNKAGRNDIGGMQFIAADLMPTFRQQAIDNFYENLDFYVKANDTNSLITVKDVTILTVNLNDSMEVDDEEVNCVSVQASWTYEISSLSDINQVQNEATFILTESGDDLVLNAILSE